MKDIKTYEEALESFKAHVLKAKNVDYKNKLLS